MTGHDQRLLEVFRAYEQAAPHPADVLAGVRTGIERRRRRQRHWRTGGIAAAVVATLVISALAVARTQDADTVPAVPADAKPLPLGEWRSTIEFGYLPEVTGQSKTSSTAISEEIIHELAGGGHLRLSVDKVDWDPPLDLAGWRRIEINGQPGREISRPSRTIIGFRLPSGRWAEVELGTPPGPQAQDDQPRARDEALRVATGLRESAGTALRVRFAPAYLPPDQRIIGVGIMAGQPTGHGEIVCAAGSLAFVRAAEYSTGDGIVGQFATVDQGRSVRIQVLPANPNLPRHATRIDDIQGRPAYALDNRTRVAVLDFHGGMLQVSGEVEPHTSGTSRTPFAELVAVAEGVRWLG